MSSLKERSTLLKAPLTTDIGDIRYKLATLPPVTTYWNGKTIYTYGHSYLGELSGLGDPAYVNSAADYYSNLLTAYLGMTKVKRAVPGSQIEQVMKQAIYQANMWTGATAGDIVLLESMINSIRANGTSTLGYASATNSLRTLLALFTSSSRVEHDDASVFTFGPGWTLQTSTTAYTSNGATNFSTAQNSYVDITLPTNPTGIYYLLTIVRQSTGPVFEVKDVTAGNVILSTTDLSAMTIATPAGNTATPPATTSNNGVIKIQAPAGHVIRVTRTDNNAVAAHIDALLLQSATPPLTVVVKEQKLNATGWATGGGSDYHAGTDAAADAYAAICDTVAAEFPNVITSNASPYWNSATCLGTDNVHPNTAGYQALFDGVIDALEGYLTAFDKIQLADLSAGVQTSLAKADSAVPKSLMTAKGDLILGSGNGTVIRLPAGNDGQTVVYDSSTASGMKPAAAGGGGSAPLPTTVKTAATYTAAAGELVLVNSTSNAVAITFPTGPADGTLVGFRHITQGASNAVTVQRGGSDVFKYAGGPTSLSYATVDTTIVFEYKGGVWTPLWSENPAATGAPIIETPNVVAAASTSVTLPDVTSAQQHDVQLTAASCAVTLPTPARGKSFLVRYRQDATGSRVITHTSTVHTPGGVAHVLSTGANKCDDFLYNCVDGSFWDVYAVGFDVR